MKIKPRRLFTNRISHEAYRALTWHKASAFVKALYDKEIIRKFDTFAEEIRFRFGLTPLIIGKIDYFQVEPTPTSVVTPDKSIIHPYVAQARVLYEGSSYFFGKRPPTLASLPYKAVVGTTGVRLFDHVESHDLREFANHVSDAVDALRRAYEDHMSHMVTIARNLDKTLNSAYQYNTFGSVEWPELEISA